VYPLSLLPFLTLPLPYLQVNRSVGEDFVSNWASRISGGNGLDCWKNLSSAARTELIADLIEGWFHEVRGREWEFAERALIHVTNN